MKRWETKTLFILQLVFHSVISTGGNYFLHKKFVEKYSNKKIILFSIPLYEDYEIIKNEDYREKFIGGAI